jgi:hypothetical protein
MRDALIGHTGFVGSTLARERKFASYFNSSTIDEIDGGHFDTVVCAGVSAVKWLANKEPARDRAAIQGLIKHLDTILAAHFILISTIDVYRKPIGVTEADTPPTENLHPYGLHRLELEQFVAQRFAKHTIVRLPGLFGAGLRKNLIFDMLHGNQLDKISPNGVLQWYPMRRFAVDLSRIASAAPKLINIAVEPVLTEAIRAELFPDLSIGSPELPAPKYDMRTDQAAILGGEGKYHIRAAEVLGELESYVDTARASV